MSSASSASTSDESPPWEAKRGKTKPGRWRKWLSWALGLGLLGLIGYGLRPRPVEVEVAKVSRGPLTVHVSEEGKTRIRNRYVVSTPVAGQMRRVLFKAGDEIKAGETVLTVIEPTLAPFLDPRAEAQARARVEAMEAALKRAEETAEMARTSSRFADANWERLKKIEDSGSVSVTDRDNAERQALMGRQEVSTAEFALQVARYELEQARAALMQLVAPGENTMLEVKAPVSGQVLKVMQESAAVVTAGTQLMEVGDAGDLEIEAEILSRDAVTIEPGALVSIEQWGGDPVKARVRRVEPAAFTKVSALGVEEQRVIVLSDLVDPPPAVKRLGDRYRVEVRVAVWHRDDVLLIPAGAVFREGNRWKAFVWDHGRTKVVDVEAGRSNGQMTELLRGLEEGTEILLHPPDTVKDGTRIRRRTSG